MQLWIVDERLRQLHSLPHAGRVPAHLAVPLLEETDVPQRLRGSLARGAPRKPVHLRHVRDELGGADLEREAVVLGHVAESAVGSRARCAATSRSNIAAEPDGRREQAEQDLDQRALAGAVRPDEPDHAGFEREVEVVERDDRAIGLRQRPRGDQSQGSRIVAIPRGDWVRRPRCPVRLPTVRRRAMRRRARTPYAVPPPRLASLYPERRL